MIWNRQRARSFPANQPGLFEGRETRRRSIPHPADDRLAALAELTRRVAQGPESLSLIEELTRTIADKIGMKAVGVATWEAQTDELIFRGGYGWSPQVRIGTRISTQPDSPAHRIFVFGKPMVIDDVASDDRLRAPRLLLQQGVTSGLVAPIIRNGFPFGIIGAFSATHRRFSSSDIDFFQTATNLLSSGLESDQLRREIAAVVAKERREALSKISFIANASHELRSPLNVILGYCEVLGERLSETGDPNAQGWMHAVERAGNRLLGTVDDILDYSRIESGTVPKAVERLQLAPLVETVVRSATAAAVAKQIGLSCSIDAPNVFVDADRRSLTIALTKILANAIKFTEHGAVEVGLKMTSRNAAMIEIRDSGIGIAADYMPRLFEPFSQERDNYARPFEGIGLGLTIARHFLEINNARIAVRSEKGRGSVFTIHFPRVMARPARKPSSVPPPLDLNARRQPLISGTASR